MQPKETIVTSKEEIMEIVEMEREMEQGMEMGVRVMGMETGMEKARVMMLGKAMMAMELEMALRVMMEIQTV